MGAYNIVLTEADVRTIAFIGRRYCWSAWASRLEEGCNELTESEAWEFNEQIEADMEGGHSPFPMLDEGSSLYNDLLAFTQSIV